MTWFQIAATGIAGPIAIILLLRLYAFFKGSNEYTIGEAMLLIVCALVITISFIGVK